MPLSENRTWRGTSNRIDSLHNRFDKKLQKVDKSQKFPEYPVEVLAGALGNL